MALAILLSIVVIFTLHSSISSNAADIEKIEFETSTDLYIDKYMGSKFSIELPIQKLGINSVLKISGELKGLPINQSFWNITLDINICNRNGEKIVISYTNPLVDIAFFSSEGEEIYRWSHNKFFAQVVNVIEIETDKCISIHGLINDVIPYKYVEVVNIARLYMNFNIGKYEILVLINMVRTPQVTIITRTMTLTTMPITTATTLTTPQQFRFINIVLNKPNTLINISIETKISRGALSYMYVSNGTLIGLYIVTNDFIEDLEKFEVSQLRIPGVELERGRTYYIVSAFGAKDKKELVRCLTNELTKLVSLKIILLEPNDLSNITKLLDLLKYREWPIAVIHWDKNSGSWVIDEYSEYYAHRTITIIPSITPTYVYSEAQRSTTIYSTNPKSMTTTPNTTTMNSTNIATSSNITTVTEIKDMNNIDHIVLIIIGISIIIIVAAILLKKIFI